MPSKEEYSDRSYSYSDYSYSEYSYSDYYVLYVLSLIIVRIRHLSQSLTRRGGTNVMIINHIKSMFSNDSGYI